jgi:hypothetical protein
MRVIIRVGLEKNSLLPGMQIIGPSINFSAVDLNYECEDGFFLPIRLYGLPGMLVNDDHAYFVPNCYRLKLSGSVFSPRKQYLVPNHLLFREKIDFLPLPTVADRPLQLVQTDQGENFSAFITQHSGAILNYLITDRQVIDGKPCVNFTVGHEKEVLSQPELARKLAAELIILRPRGFRLYHDLALKSC